MSTIDQREEARYRQDVLVSYRAWLTYLEAQQTLLATAADAQAGADPFEGLNASQERSEAARQRLAGLAADKRELFDAIVEAERQQIQRQLDAEAPLRGGTVKRADPDEVARRALSRLHEEARGLHREDRRGLVPRGKPEAVKWLALDLSEIALSPPSETDYQLAGERPRARRSILMNLVFAALALAGIPVLLLLLQQPVRQATTLRQPMTNDAALSLWPILTVGESEGGPRLPVRTVTSSWPAECGAETAGQACWLDHSYRPVRLCLTAATLDGLKSVSLEAGGSTPTRVYQLTREAATSPDLIISPCGEASAKVATRYGYLIGLDEPITLAPGDDSYEGFRLSAITVIGRGARPDLPEGRMVVSVALEESGEARDWGGLAPKLLLAVDLAAPQRRSGDHGLPQTAALPQPDPRRRRAARLSPGPAARPDLVLRAGDPLRRRPRAQPGDRRLLRRAARRAGVPGPHPRQLGRRPHPEH